jgi:large subunit ribosomal protein L10
MAKTKLQKIVILDHLKSSVASQKAVVLISTKDTKTTLNASTNYDFRTKARENNVKVELIKNTLIEKSLFTDNTPALSGQVYITYLLNSENSNEVQVPKAVVGLLEKDFKDNFIVIGSIVNGEFKNSEDTIQLSKMPSFDDSMGMMAGQISRIISKIASTVQEVPASLGRAIKAIN